MTFVERLLHWMQRPTFLRQAFDGHHVMAFGLHRQHQARPDRRSIEQHRAAAANAVLAAHVCAGEPEVMTDVIGQEAARLERRWMRDAVDLHAAKALSISTLMR
jgi:hypothetical protein